VLKSWCGGRCSRGERSGYFKVTRMEQHAEPARGFNFSFDWSGNSKSISKDTKYTYAPPTYNGCGRGRPALCISKLKACRNASAETANSQCAKQYMATRLAYSPLCYKTPMNSARLHGTVTWMPSGLCIGAAGAGRRMLAVRTLWWPACSWR